MSFRRHKNNPQAFTKSGKGKKPKSLFYYIEWYIEEQTYETKGGLKPLNYL